MCSLYLYVYTHWTEHSYYQIASKYVDILSTCHVVFHMTVISKYFTLMSLSILLAWKTPVLGEFNHLHQEDGTWPCSLGEKTRCVRSGLEWDHPSGRHGKLRKRQHHWLMQWAKVCMTTFVIKNPILSQKIEDIWILSNFEDLAPSNCYAREKGRCRVQ